LNSQRSTVIIAFRIFNSNQGISDGIIHSEHLGLNNTQRRLFG
jgi:hypothetical protein